MLSPTQTLVNFWSSGTSRESETTTHWTAACHSPFKLSRNATVNRCSIACGETFDPHSRAKLASCSHFGFDHRKNPNTTVDNNELAVNSRFL